MTSLTHIMLAFESSSFSIDYSNISATNKKFQIDDAWWPKWDFIHFSFWYHLRLVRLSLNLLSFCPLSNLKVNAIYKHIRIHTFFFHSQYQTFFIYCSITYHHKLMAYSKTNYLFHSWIFNLVSAQQECFISTPPGWGCSTVLDDPLPR